MGIRLGKTPPRGRDFRLAAWFFTGCLTMLAAPLFLLSGCQGVEHSLQALRQLLWVEGDKGAQEAEEETLPPRFGGLPSGRLQPGDALADPSSLAVQTGAIAPQDTVDSLLTGNGLTPGQVQEVLAAAGQENSLARIGEGRRYEVAAGREGLRRFLLQLDGERRLRIYRTRQGALRARVEQIPYDVQAVRLEGKIQGSLFETVAEGGATPAVAMEIADIFSYVIDFHKELREGDKLQVLLERRALDGEGAGFGRILAAKLTVRGKEHTAFHYGGSGDYYSAQGETLRRAFLRAPLRYTRVSSRFSHARFHPILMRTRPHYGVDYAAPAGTPVHSVAEGVVAWAGPRGEAGNTIRIIHPGWYETSYFHLSRFAEGIRPGRKVRQGEVIGYVGATGLATGPHLDYRIVHRGRPIDPLAAELPSGWPLLEEKRVEFRRAVQEMEAGWAKAPLLEAPDGEVASASAAERPLF
ncbi:MAG: peptidoglycan DD-metalloendopeptidase family protein [Nitrospinota bacterium]